jgi:hypothetical protein
MKYRACTIVPLLYIFLFIIATYAIDEVDYSTFPPDSMDSQTLPQLICLGFDDNKFYSGMKWVMDMLQDRKNPAGVGEIGNTVIKNSSDYFRANELTIGKITPRLLQITVPYTSNYSIALFDTKGRIVTSVANSNLAKGTPTVPCHIKNIGSSLYILRIKTRWMGTGKKFITL